MTLQPFINLGIFYQQVHLEMQRLSPFFFFELSTRKPALRTQIKIDLKNESGAEDF